jgi:hypothetical protein
VLYQYTGHIPLISGPQILSTVLLLCLLTCPLRALGFAGVTWRGWFQSEFGQFQVCDVAIVGQLWVLWTHLVGYKALCSFHGLFPLRGVQWLPWLVHKETLSPALSTYTSTLMILLGSEESIAPVTCIYMYIPGLGGRLRALASWPAHLSALLVLG